MFDKTLSDLQFPLLLAELAELCLSDEGRQVLAKLTFIYDQTELRKQQELMQALVDLGQSEATKPQTFAPISDIFLTLERPKRALSGEQLYNVALYLQAGQIFASYCHTPLVADNPTLASELFSPFNDQLAHLKEELLATLESTGEVKASHPALKALRSQLERLRNERHAYGIRFLRSQGDAAQAELPAFRSGRSVLPIRSDRQSEVHGFVHSTSASQATVFMEPFALVELNNQCIMAEQKLELEVARILADLSSHVRLVLSEIEQLQREVGRADALWARCRFAERYRCVQALPSSDGSLVLLEARHPLLGKTAVPITLSISQAIRTVVISGPNAGGKTVTLKTVGLFVLLNQFFYTVPAAEGTTLPLYDNVFTDIGDDQSILDSLSTFSGHMKRMSAILAQCSPHSLVILDELGSQTDPVEGSAIARSVLEYCKERVALTLISSHHSVLKQYAYAHADALNVSMEFDRQSGESTFRIIEGLPGESHALESARRMQLPPEVIRQAEQYLGSEQLEISNIIRELEEQRRIAHERKKALEVEERSQLERRRELDLYKLRLEQKELLMLRKSLGTLDHFISDSRSKLENLVQELRQGEITREKTKQVKSFISELEEREKQSRKSVQERQKVLDNKKEEPVKQELAVGMDVLVISSRREGRIVRAAKRGHWVVAIGPMKFTLAEQELKVLVKPADQTVTHSFESSGSAPKQVIDVRGFTLNEALAEVEKQLERSLIHSMTTFAIIHGMGEGVLATGIHHYLAQAPHVKSFHYAQAEDGGFGKTYVQL